MELLDSLYNIFIILLQKKNIHLYEVSNSESELYEITSHEVIFNDFCNVLTGFAVFFSL